MASETREMAWVRYRRSLCAHIYCDGCSIDKHPGEINCSQFGLVTSARPGSILQLHAKFLF
jgi:hypothetical protein